MSTSPTSSCPNGPVSWPVAALAVYGDEARRGNTPDEKAKTLRKYAARLRRYVESGVDAGSDDPRPQGRTGARIVLGELYRCFPELRHARDRDAMARIREIREEVQTLARDVAKAEVELAIKRHERQRHGAVAG